MLLDSLYKNTITQTQGRGAHPAALIHCLDEEEMQAIKCEERRNTHTQQHGIPILREIQLPLSNARQIMGNSESFASCTSCNTHWKRWATHTHTQRNSMQIQCWYIFIYIFCLEAEPIQMTLLFDFDNRDLKRKSFISLNKLSHLPVS